jgi:hypothetical protein
LGLYKLATTATRNSAALGKFKGSKGLSGNECDTTAKVARF